MGEQYHTAFVAALASPAATLEQVSGKGASLARLARAGLPVPPGFHVTTAAYRQFVGAHRLREPILAAVAGASPKDVYKRQSPGWPSVAGC